MVVRYNQRHDRLGITKREKEKKRDEKAAELGLKWHEGEGAAKGYYVTEAGGPADPNKLKIMEGYQKAADEAPPGFFEGIPGITDLTSAIRDLIAALSAPAQTAASAITEAINPLFGIISEERATDATGQEWIKQTRDDGTIKYRKERSFLEGWSDEPIEDSDPRIAEIAAMFNGGVAPTGITATPAAIEIPNKESWIADQMGKNPNLSRENAEASWKQNYPGYASGTDYVPKTGPAILHKGERVLTADQNKVFGGIHQAGGAGSGSRSTSINVGGLKVEVNNPVVPDSGAAYHLSDILRRELEPFIEESIKRKVSQYIT